MRVSRVSKPFHDKPPAGSQINWASPLARGLQVLMPTNEGIGPPFDAVGGQVATSATGHTWTAGPYSSALDFVAANSATVRVARPSASFTGWSMACWFRIATSTTGTVYMMAWTNTGDNSPIGAIVHNVTGSVAGNISASWRNNSSVAARVDVTSPTYNDSQWHHAVGVFDPNGFKIFIDGVNVSGPLTGFPQSGTLTTNGLCLGSLQRTTNNYYTCSVDMPMAWDRLLSEGEATALYYTPGQLFISPKKAWRFGATLGATSYTLTCAAETATGAGQAASLLASRRLALAAETATGAGQAATLRATRLLACAAEAATGVGQAANLTRGKFLTLAAETATGAGIAATLTAARYLALAGETATGVGRAATLNYSNAPQVTYPDPTRARWERGGPDPSKSYFTR